MFSPQAEEPELLEVVADIGRAAADNAVEIAIAEEQDLVAEDARGSLAVVESSSEDVMITHKYRGLQQFSRVKYSTQIY